MYVLYENIIFFGAKEIGVGFILKIYFGTHDVQYTISETKFYRESEIVHNEPG